MRLLWKQMRPAFFKKEFGTIFAYIRSSMQYRWQLSVNKRISQEPKGKKEMKITIKPNNCKNSDNTLLSDASKQETANNLIGVSVSTKQIFTMKVAPGTTIDELASSLAAQGYDINNAEVTVTSYGDNLDLSNGEYRIKNGDCIAFTITKLNLKSLTEEISNLISDIDAYADKGDVTNSHSEDRHLSSEKEIPSLYNTLDEAFQTLLLSLGIKRGEARMTMEDGKAYFTFIPGK